VIDILADLARAAWAAAWYRCANPSDYWMRRRERGYDVNGKAGGVVGRYHVEGGNEWVSLPICPSLSDGAGDVLGAVRGVIKRARVMADVQNTVAGVIVWMLIERLSLAVARFAWAAWESKEEFAVEACELRYAIEEV
jgi:hypothetical protein